METFIKTERNVGTSSVSINMFTDPNFPNSATGNRLNRVDLWYFGGTDGSQFAARVVAEEDIYFDAQYTKTIYFSKDIFVEGLDYLKLIVGECWICFLS